MLTSKGKYGLKALLHLADNEGQGPSLIADIAAKNDIPKKFLDAILLELKNAASWLARKAEAAGILWPVRRTGSSSVTLSAPSTVPLLPFRARAGRLTGAAPTVAISPCVASEV